MTTDQPNDYMSKCPWCHQFVLQSQVNQHVCDAPLIDVREIPVLFCYTTTDKKGFKITIARGFDGILYRLAKCKNPLADDWKQQPETDDKVPAPGIAMFLRSKNRG